MKNYEFDKVAEANLYLENARDMISAFFSDYFETTDHTRLKEDDLEHIAVKFLAISEFVSNAQRSLEMAFGNSQSSLVSMYVKDVDDYKDYLRERAQ